MAMPAPEYAPPPAPDMLEVFLSLETPPGFRAELIDREIIVTPPPDGNHESVLNKIIRQIHRHPTIDFDVSATKGVITPSGRFIPDLTVCPDGTFEDEEPWMPPDSILLVAETTSTNPGRDRWAKRKGYAAAGIPLYLLVDREQRTVVLHSDPDVDSGDYLDIHNVPFGKDVPLPTPFDFVLETKDF